MAHRIRDIKVFGVLSCASLRVHFIGLIVVSIFGASNQLPLDAAFELSVARLRLELLHRLVNDA